MSKAMSISTALVERIKLNEGSMSYQAKLGYIKNQTFQLYKDSLGYWTIGYGHLCSEIEIVGFVNGITELEADVLLMTDINEAKQQAMKWISTSNETVQELLIEMVFQLGITRAMKFKKFKAAIEKQDMKQAAVELKQSLWFKQTPNRVKNHIKVLNNI
ncbi:glycoside hydrolase family protein [Aeromonas salmonicida]|uniref:glycoside hydrolase family protein n=1 Tax=Aeromonas salmonicida TaxID=645 RepID=UPI003D194D3F